jgi:L-threonylcarbamoyladenylate synthase
MLIIRIAAAATDADAIARVVDIVRGGGVIAYATDTLYGLAVDPRSDAAVERLFTVKGRDEGVAIPLIAASLEQADGVGVLGHAEMRLASAFWPGPLTIVVPARPGLSARVLAGGDTVAVRVPAHEVARTLAAACGHAVTSTSANRSGQAPPTSASEIDPSLASELDAILDSGPAPGGSPSTIVKAVGARVELLRAGAIAWDRVLESLE